MIVWLRGHFYISRGALILFLLSWCVFGGFVVNQQVTLANQQHRDSELAKQNLHLSTLVCRLSAGLALNEPNLDQRFVRILDQIVTELPTRCLP